MQVCERTKNQPKNLCCIAVSCREPKPQTSLVVLVSHSLDCDKPAPSTCIRSCISLVVK